MFVQKKRFAAKAADALDLVIDFATLGEYGLEYPEGHPVPTVSAPCGPAPERVRPSTRTRRPARPGRQVRKHIGTGTNVEGPVRTERNRRRPCGETRLPEALLPPRITLDV